MNPTEGPQIGPQRCAGPLTGVAVHLTPAIAIIIPRPFVNAVTNSGMARVTPPVAWPCIRREPRAGHRAVLRDQRWAGARLGMVAAPQALRPRLAREQTEAGGTIMGVGPVPLPPMGATPGRVGGVSRRRAFVPPHAGTAQPLQRRSPPSQPSGPSRCGGSEAAAAGYGAASVSVLTRGRGGPSARPSLSRAGAAPRSLAAGGFSRSWSPSGGCKTPGRPDNGRRGSGLGHGRDAGRRARTAGLSDHPGGDAVRANACRGCHPITRRSESLA
jgi:hypothetical protein